MATNLRKFKYTGGANATSAPANRSSSKGCDELPPRHHNISDTDALRAEILHDLKADISTVIKSELKNALAVDFGFLKSELQNVKTEIQGCRAALHGKVDQVTITHGDEDKEFTDPGKAMDYVKKKIITISDEGK